MRASIPPLTQKYPKRLLSSPFFFSSEALQPASAAFPGYWLRMQSPCLTKPCQCSSHAFMNCLHVGKDIKTEKRGPLWPRGHIELWVIFTPTQPKARLTWHLWQFGREEPSPPQGLGEGSKPAIEEVMPGRDANLTLTPSPLSPESLPLPSRCTTTCPNFFRWH